MALEVFAHADSGVAADEFKHRFRGGLRFFFDAEVDAAVFPVVFDGVGDDVHHDAAQQGETTFHIRVADVFLEVDRDVPTAA